ncbi:MAG: hypothetical protein COZ68_03830 [Deltaproteobacteria bacterium CG_4_8_14_3_um_filter_43_13]|nr:MAG: hypothetical protein AUK23_07275 [Deltaproteobacteria bacterium CG2_30_43_15]PIU85518.1 MAG: hypothetical protein COS67_07420 [Deltaproteobacteria bacterium CG06_land_8_20_14_3_00_44_19]PIX25512.1 MAG: hypothetical protein COZ68_03830 [Deltaproteobacteria bacterium CG_4_8_14_3_um_filter_43_13]PIZ19369.1 MAG: hypothetical protein COY50_10365 [Deltaproteobacteria bacterium CG_4_10_14_0_8_um_filter_43_12]
MPLRKIGKRNESIDLLGFDENQKPYIIELKKPTANDSIDKIIDQINSYADCFDTIRDNVQREVRERYLWKAFQFSKGIGKIILSSRSFFNGKQIKSFKEIGIYVCSFSGLKENFNNINILGKCGSKGVVRLKIENR